MANLSRYDQFNIDTMFDDLVKGFLVHPMRYENAPKVADIKVEVSESSQNYVVKAEIPGVRKDEIQVAIDGNVVSLSAEVKRESEPQEDAKIIHSERYYGRVARSFSLGSEIDEAEALAKYADGVLELTLPKKAAASAKTLTIQ